MDRRDGYIMNEIMLRAENIERTYHAGSVDVPALKNCTLEFGQRISGINTHCTK